MVGKLHLLCCWLKPSWQLVTESCLLFCFLLSSIQQSCLLADRQQLCWRSLLTIQQKREPATNCKLWLLVALLSRHCWLKPNSEAALVLSPCSAQISEAGCQFAAFSCWSAKLAGRKAKQRSWASRARRSLATSEAHKWASSVARSRTSFFLFLKKKKERSKERKRKNFPRKLGKFFRTSFLF